MIEIHILKNGKKVIGQWIEEAELPLNPSYIEEMVKRLVKFYFEFETKK